jgi:hypothetical protein
MRVDMRPLESGATGMSMCLAVTVSIMACLTGCAVRSGWGMTASMDLSGGLHGVDSISAKVQAMHQVGVKHVILAPLGYDPLLLSGRLPRAVQLHFCTTVTEALLLCLEPHPENGAEGGAVPGQLLRQDCFLVSLLLTVDMVLLTMVEVAMMPRRFSIMW